MNILIAHGVNLDLLGRRNSTHYGSLDLKQLTSILDQKAEQISHIFQIAIHLSHFQTNDEKEYLERVSQSRIDGAILNPGAWTHTSLALADRLEAVGLKFIEVHLSLPETRESIRRISHLRMHAQGVICGLKETSYTSALYAIVEILIASQTTP
ncbi:MAG: type II 3-dehydroquinate dehydratase [Zetaproteobacteria bacterium]|nr:type II 3-dehydroquinate dehydratase [Zetaproteobacteria bacterium]